MMFQEVSKKTERFIEQMPKEQRMSKDSASWALR